MQSLHDKAVGAGCTHQLQRGGLRGCALIRQSRQHVRQQPRLVLHALGQVEHKVGQGVQESGTHGSAAVGGQLAKVVHLAGAG